ncbi:MAG: PrgI family protein [bacterium]|nr:PrgI family protein [bacterium]
MTDSKFGMTPREIMENHPIPQDITSFQFKIIGNMTIRQFAYLATGSILAWIFFSLPIFFAIKFFFVAFFFLFGVFLAFIPISGRPLDAMISRFVKALFIPNQYIYQKTAAAKALPQPAISLSQPLPTVPLVRGQTEENLQKEAAILEKELEAAKSNEANKQQTPQKDEAHKKTELLEQQLQDVLLQKQQLEKQLTELTRNLELHKQNSGIKPVVKTTNSQAVKAPPAHEAPNIITGIVKDPRGNIISNILIEVKDHEGNPVRAFKTNSLGQFASATPLTNGTYTLTFDDPRNIHKFENIELIAKGEDIPLITVISTDPREDLRKDLFGV